MAAARPDTSYQGAPVQSSAAHACYFQGKLGIAGAQRDIGNITCKLQARSYQALSSDDDLWPHMDFGFVPAEEDNQRNPLSPDLHFGCCGLLPVVHC